VLCAQQVDGDANPAAEKGHRTDRARETNGLPPVGRRRQPASRTTTAAPPTALRRPPMSPSRRKLETTTHCSARARSLPPGQRQSSAQAACKAASVASTVALRAGPGRRRAGDARSPRARGGLATRRGGTCGRRCVRTRAAVVNLPHTPTGTHIDRTTFDALFELADAAGAHLVYDEVYRWSELDPASQPPARRGRALQPRVESRCDVEDPRPPALRTGWFATRDRALLERLAALKDYTTIGNSARSEILALMALVPAPVPRRRVPPDPLRPVFVVVWGASAPLAALDRSPTPERRPNGR